ncbi:hypothetical protein [Emticicia oligotrophica]|nr:hypothetical protein [Emticicia oligotrophica]
MKNSLKSMLRLSNRTKSFIILFLIACGPMPFDYDEFKSFFSPESAANESIFRPYNFTTQFTYGNNYWSAEANLSPDQSANQQAWAEYAGISEKEVGAELYPAYGENNSNALSNALQRKGKTEALEYLTLAKEIESVDTAYEDPYAENDTTKAQTPTDYVALESKIQDLSARTNDSFLKERLAYQAVKVADMADNPKKSIDLYEKLVKPLKTKTFISDWAASRMAGAYMHAGDSTSAFYHFSQILVNAPTRQSAAYLSLKRITKFGEDALKLCKNDNEKANLYAATAVLPLQDGLPLLEKIKDLDSKNKLLEFVMAREINKNEYYFFNNQETLQYGFWEVDSLTKVSWKSNAKNYFEKLLAFNLDAAEDANLKSSPFWYTAASYLAFIGKDLSKAQELLQKAKAIPTDNQSLKDQIAMQEMIFAVSETDVVTPNMEATVMPLLERFARSDKFRVANNFNAACKIMAAKYEELPVNDEFAENLGEKSTVVSSQSNKSLGWFSGCFGKKSKDEKTAEGVLVSTASPENQAKAFILKVLASAQQAKQTEYGGTASFMSNTDQYEIEAKTSSKVINYVIDYFKKKSPNNFDQKLQAMAGFNNEYLYTVLGRRALAEHQYAQAAEAWKNVSPQTWQAEPFQTYLDVNPFSLNGLGDSNAKQRTTPVAFAKRMAELESKIKQNPNDFESLILLGCGSYNMSYYGNSWILLRREWSTNDTFDENDDYFSYDKALSYFDKAMQVAPKPELAAKACFMAATCQQIKYAGISSKMYDGIYSLPEDEMKAKEEAIKQTLSSLKKDKYSTYFNLLKTKYGSTAYEEQLIEECSTYKDYLAGK